MTRFSRLTLAAIAPISLLALAGCSSAPLVSAVSPNAVHRQVSSLGIQRLAVPQCTRDFALSVTPSTAVIPAGSSKTFEIGLTSLCGLAGSINVGTTRISPSGNGRGPTPHQARYDLPLDANGKTGIPVTYSTTAMTSRRSYEITITAKDVTGGCCYGVTHTATVTLTIE
ncbi:MAG TPA: hypothetical protein VKT51_00405 [Candidatus Eremiobacteraceae bacterium]|nr:hypothetical protein [Candidatus Eremiobacteraceae bacterium]